jgi:tetratricopeptide (TPR) repeat protein
VRTSIAVGRLNEGIEVKMPRTGWLRYPVWVGPLALACAIASGCTQRSSSDRSPAGPADSVAYALALGIEDGPARLAAIEAFIDEYPQSKWTEQGYPKIVALASEHEPDRVESILRRFLTTDLASPNPYNAIGWQLAEAGEHLDLAVAILEKAVAKARAGGDADNLASCLDSEAWARYKAGDYATAVERMEEAYETIGPGNDEIDMHMALIYDAAGLDEKAQPLYIALLGHMENPLLREKLAAIVTSSGGSLDAVNAEIEALREAVATPAPELTLPSLADGEPISLSDLRGRVVLLNFWHPT